MGIAFAICRAAKIKSLSALKAHAGHAARTRETLNASTALTPFNQVLVGSGDPATDALDRLSILPKPPRKNGVLAIDLLLTASPEYFRPDFPEMAGAYEMNRLHDFNTLAVAWAKDYFGSDNVCSIICHVDESTPHLSVTVVPVDETPRKKGERIRLNASRWLDGKKKLQAMQDSFADAMKPLGLERGVRGSSARHQDIKKYYGQMKALPTLQIKHEAAMQVVRDSNRLYQDAYRQGRIDQANKDMNMLSTLRNRVRKLIKALRSVRSQRKTAIGALEKPLDTAIPKIAPRGGRHRHGDRSI